MGQERTIGGSLLRQAMDELKTQIDQEEKRPQVAAFVAYDKETGAQIGAAYLWQGPNGSEWSVTGILSKKVQTAESPYAVRLELKGKL